MRMVKQCITYIVNAITDLMHLLYTNLYFFILYIFYFAMLSLFVVLNASIDETHV